MRESDNKIDGKDEKMKLLEVKVSTSQLRYFIPLIFYNVISFIGYKELSDSGFG